MSPSILVRTQLSFCLLSRFRKRMRGGSEQAVYVMSVPFRCPPSLPHPASPQFPSAIIFVVESIRSFPPPFFRVSFALHCRRWRRAVVSSLLFLSDQSRMTRILESSDGRSVGLGRMRERGKQIKNSTANARLIDFKCGPLP